jgi:ABC-type nickel/cobalt efflux system permease component RcnA
MEWGLVGSVVVIGLIHGVLPDHGWPIAATYALNRPRKWLYGTAAALLLGGGHLVSSVALVAAYFWFARFAEFADGPWLRYVAGTLLILLGVHEYRYGSHGADHDGRRHTHAHGARRGHSHGRDYCYSHGYSPDGGHRLWRWRDRGEEVGHDHEHRYGHEHQHGQEHGHDHGPVYRSGHVHADERDRTPGRGHESESSHTHTRPGRRPEGASCRASGGGSRAAATSTSATNTLSGGCSPSGRRRCCWDSPTKNRSRSWRSASAPTGAWSWSSSTRWG